MSKLANAPAPSGFENRVREIIAEELEELGYEPVTDSLGNLYVVLGEGRPSLVLAAHMDEVGFIVTHVTEDGFLRVAPLGGVVAEGLPGQEVVVLTDEGLVEGVIGATPPHLRGATQKELTVEEIFIDIGVLSREEARSKGVDVGSPVTFAGNFKERGDAVISKALDDRVGCYALLEALRSGATPKKGSVVVAFTVQEEVGLRGSSALAKALEPNFAVAVEGTIANDTPGTPPEKVVTRLGRGPAVRLMDKSMIASMELYKHIKALAESKSIPYQVQISPYSGTDAGSFAVHGAAVSAVSVPVRYIHSPASLALKKDVDATVELLKALIEEPFP